MDQYYWFWDRWIYLRSIYSSNDGEENEVLSYFKEREDKNDKMIILCIK
ncbi:hypothetical protein MKY30_12085 [Oceanobacillus sp. FSL W8-0428]|uniref:Uncharacterized protein n=1 Tax=Oceanobacillus sojae TaxID=582851 RepID=A0A511ZL12_9BACI|nr:hypothetical protein [Oceanobacillus sojae]GEN88158.1 hypothetical protein OSO01_28970 [Oceanobacillus sojae]